MIEMMIITLFLCALFVIISGIDVLFWLQIIQFFEAKSLKKRFKIVPFCLFSRLFYVKMTPFFELLEIHLPFAYHFPKWINSVGNRKVFVTVNC